MLNKNPIFIVAFSRGGSNILLNFLRSHPHVCSPRGETQEVFKGKGKVEPFQARLDKAINYLPIRALQKEDIFSLDLWKKREAVGQFKKFLIDRILYKEKLKALDPSQNYYKAENLPYALEEIKESRLLCKNLDGLIFLTDMFYEMYPDATFIALVRNGLAVCEGHIRRGADSADIARKYEMGCQKIIEDSRQLPNYHVIRYEDIIANPEKCLERICFWADLDLSLVNKIRMETKPVIQANGQHSYVHGKNRKTLVWYDRDKFWTHFVEDANENQINRLTAAETKTILRCASGSLKFFSYI